MEVFYRVLVLALRRQLTYRAAILAGLATNTFFGLMRAFLLAALYAGQGEVNGVSLAGAFTFVGMSQAIIAFISIFGSSDLLRSVYSGEIATDLLRPLELFTWWLSMDLGKSLVNLVGRGLTLLFIFSLFFPLVLPAQPEQWFFLLISLLLAWLASFAWRFLVNLSAFWTPDATGVGRFAFTFSQMCSGFVFPLRLMPEWFNTLCHWTPFPAMVNTPIEIYLGVITGAEMWQAIAAQAFWCLTLILVGQLIFRSGLRRLVIQGG